MGKLFKIIFASVCLVVFALLSIKLLFAMIGFVVVGDQLIDIAMVGWTGLGLAVNLCITVALLVWLKSITNENK